MYLGVSPVTWLSARRTRLPRIIDILVVSFAASTETIRDLSAGAKSFV